MTVKKRAFNTASDKSKTRLIDNFDVTQLEGPVQPARFALSPDVTELTEGTKQLPALFKECGTMGMARARKA